MEEQLIVDRARLRELLHTKPDWTQEAYAAERFSSADWVRSKGGTSTNGTSRADDILVNGLQCRNGYHHSG